MKKKYLIILIIFILLIIILLIIMLPGCYLIVCINNTIPSVQALEDADFIINYISKKEDNIKTFIATKDISLNTNGENKEYYLIVLIDRYSVENQLLEHINSVTKLYKIVFKKRKVISSDSINIEDTDSYNNYSVFPEEIITKYKEIKDSIDLQDYLTKKINRQIENYYNETNKQK